MKLAGLGHYRPMALLSASHPPPVAEIQTWVLDSPGELKLLRASLYRAITGREFPKHAQLDDVPEKLVLVATELATNALRHGLPPTIVKLGRADHRFILDVADHEPQVPPALADDRAPGEGGLGLQLAKKLTLDLGWYVKDGTKHVWAEFE
jgi:serine/threonine-protein kinase RsbW